MNTQPVTALDNAAQNCLLFIDSQIVGLNPAEIRELAEIIGDCSWYLARYADQPRLRLVE